MDMALDGLRDMISLLLSLMLPKSLLTPIQTRCSSEKKPLRSPNLRNFASETLTSSLIYSTELSIACRGT